MTNPNPGVTTTEVLTFIYNADGDFLDRVIEAVKHRRSALRSIDAANVRVGAEVTIDEIRPKYLVGLSGKVTAIKGQRCTIRLDKESTTTLRYLSPRFTVREDVEEHELGGIPLSCAKVKAA